MGRYPEFWNAQDIINSRPDLKPFNGFWNKYPMPMPVKAMIIELRGKIHHFGNEKGSNADVILVKIKAGIHAQINILLRPSRESFFTIFFV